MKKVTMRELRKLSAKDLAQGMSEGLEVTSRGKVVLRVSEPNVYTSNSYPNGTPIKG